MGGRPSYISPQTLDPHRREATGAEVWAGSFVYPNGWYHGSHKRVLVKDPPRNIFEYVVFMINNYPIIRSTLLFICYVVIVCCVLYVMWALLQ